MKAIAIVTMAFLPLATIAVRTQPLTHHPVHDFEKKKKNAYE